MDENYMRLAIAQAKEAKEAGELPFGAVIVCDGEVLAQNRCREGEEQSVLCHAEALAVDDACKKLHINNLSNCTIYATNEPCLMCAAAIFQAKIPRLVIGASREDLPNVFRKRQLTIDDMSTDSGYEIEIKRGVLKNEVIELFNEINLI